MLVLAKSRFVGATVLYFACAAHCSAQVTFAPAQSHPLAAAARHVVTGDFDGDRRADFAVAGDAGLTILSSACGGTYDAPLAIAPGLVLAERGSLAAGDVDGDGRDDLVAVRPGAVPTLGEVVYLRSLGDGTFAAPQTFAVLPTPIAGQAVAPMAVTLADLDGDGRLDAAVAVSMLGIAGVPGYLAVALGQVGGGFAPAVMLPTAQSFTEAIAAADMDNDGDQDLVVSNWSDHSISIFANDGTGLAGVITTERVGHATSALPNRLAVGDLDGDGWNDVCVLRDNSAHPLLGIGAGNPRLAGQVRDTGITIFVGSQASPPLDVAADIALADVDGDGVLDLVAAVQASLGGTGRVVVCRGLGLAAFGAEQQVSMVHDAVDLAVGDFDRDGDVDVAAAGGVPQDLVVCTNAHAAPRWTDLGFALPGSLGAPCLDGTGPFAVGSTVAVRLSNVLPNYFGGFVLSPARIDVPIFGGVLVPDPSLGQLEILATSPQGTIDGAFAWPAGLPAGLALYWQGFGFDPNTPYGIAASNALRSVAP